MAFRMFLNKKQRLHGIDRNHQKVAFSKKLNRVHEFEKHAHLCSLCVRVFHVVVVVVFSFSSSLSILFLLMFLFSAMQRDNFSVSNYFSSP